METRFKPALIFGAAAASLLLMVLLMLLVNPPSAARPTINALLPVVPAAILLISVLIAYRRMDERERRIQDQAFAWGFLASCTVFVFYGVGQVLWALPGINLALACAFMLCCWGGAWLAANRRLQ